MTDYQQLVAEIRSFLQGTDMTMTDRFRELAEAFGKACQEVNERLARTDKFLRKGLRTEAAHYAKEEPNLLELVGILDFQELASFKETLIFYRITEPPTLQLEIATELNQVIRELLPMEDLLRQHRQLALSRSPLQARLRVIRQIAKVDRTSGISDDLSIFEEARVQEIEAALKGPLWSQSEQILELVAELEAKDWNTPPPPELIQKIRARAVEIGREKARAELQQVVEQLNMAMDHGDLARGQDLRPRYVDLLSRTEASPRDPLVRSAQRPLTWLKQLERLQADERRFQSALSELQAALDEKADPEEVARLYHAVQDLGHDFPTRLENRCRKYLHRADDSRRWRERLILLSVFLVGLIILLALVGYLWLKSTNRSAESLNGRCPPAVHLFTSAAKRHPEIGYFF